MAGGGGGHLLLDAPICDYGGLLLDHLDLLNGIDPTCRHVLHYGLPGLEELVLRAEELIVDAMTVSLLAPPLM